MQYSNTVVSQMFKTCCKHVLIQSHKTRARSSQVCSNWRANLVFKGGALFCPLCSHLVLLGESVLLSSSLVGGSAFFLGGAVSMAALLVVLGTTIVESRRKTNEETQRKTSKT